MTWLYAYAFVAAALFLLASGLLQQQSAGVQKLMRWLAVGLLLLYLRRFLPGLSQAGEVLVPAHVTTALAGGLLTVVALAAAAALWWLSSKAWPGLAESSA